MTDDRDLLQALEFEPSCDLGGDEKCGAKVVGLAQCRHCSHTWWVCAGHWDTITSVPRGTGLIACGMCKARAGRWVAVLSFKGLG